MTAYENFSTVIPFETLEKIAGKARIQPYLEATSWNQEVAVELYIWNLKISQAILFVTGIAEVSFRNKMSNLLQSSFLIHEEEFWYDSHVLNIFMNTTILKARKSCFKKRGFVTLDGLISELPFGFWIQFFTKEFKQILWIPYFHKEFGFESKFARDSFNEVLGWLRTSVKLRNRAAHHDSFLRIDLMNQLEELFYLISCIDPKIAKWAFETSKILNLIEDRP